MTQLINDLAVEKLIQKVLEEDMNECLAIVTKEVISKLENKVRANVAARMIVLAQSDFNIQYYRDELCIRVQMRTN